MSSNSRLVLLAVVLVFSNCQHNCKGENHIDNKRAYNNDESSNINNRDHHIGGGLHEYYEDSDSRTPQSISSSPVNDNSGDLSKINNEVASSDSLMVINNSSATVVNTASESTCEDYPALWYDSGGFDCIWYGTPSMKGYDKCKEDGDYYENFGMTANQACCTCGGGVMNTAHNDEIQSTISSTQTESKSPTPLPTNQSSAQPSLRSIRTTQSPSLVPTISIPEKALELSPSVVPTQTLTEMTALPTTATMRPTISPTTASPTSASTTASPTAGPTATPTTASPITPVPTTESPTVIPGDPTAMPTNAVPTQEPSVEPTWDSSTRPSRSPIVHPSIIPTQSFGMDTRSSTNLLGCKDTPGWHDPGGPQFNCLWYGLLPERGDENKLCEIYGDLENFGKTAREACCACGGGNDQNDTSTTIPTSTTSPNDTEDSNQDQDQQQPHNNSTTTSSINIGFVCTDVLDWYDSSGPDYSCTWYSEFTHRCYSFGVGYKNFGKTANDACCACGGGTFNS